MFLIRFLSVVALRLLSLALVGLGFGFLAVTLITAQLPTKVANPDYANGQKIDALFKTSASYLNGFRTEMKLYPEPPVFAMWQRHYSKTHPQNSIPDSLDVSSVSYHLEHFPAPATDKLGTPPLPPKTKPLKTAPNRHLVKFRAGKKRRRTVKNRLRRKKYAKRRSKKRRRVRRRKRGRKRRRHSFRVITQPVYVTTSYVTAALLPAARPATPHVTKNHSGVRGHNYMLSLVRRGKTFYYASWNKTSTTPKNAFIKTKFAFATQKQDLIASSLLFVIFAQLGWMLWQTTRRKAQ